MTHECCGPWYITTVHKEDCLCVKQVCSDLTAYSNEEEVEYTIF